MKRSLASAWAKIERAKKHVNELKSLLETLKRDNTQEVTLQYDAEHAQYFGDVRVPEGPPLSYSAVVGDIAHNLRAALDHIGFQFDNATDERVRCFPYWSDAAKLHNAIHKTGVPKRFPKRAWAIIYAVQPYSRSHPRRHAFYRIHELDRRDKHQSLNLLYVPVMTQQLSFTLKDSDGNVIKKSIFSVPTLLRGMGIKPGTIRMAYDEPFPGANVDMYGVFTFEISLDESEFGKGEFLLSAIQKMVDFTEHTLEQFIRAYPSLGPRRAVPPSRG